MMRRYFSVLFFSVAFFAIVQHVGAQTSVTQPVQKSYTIADLFKAMPDSLMPLLTTNNRLDMIDFMDAGMKSRVTNLLGGESEMTQLSADSLTIRMSNSMDVCLCLLSTTEAYDSCQQVVCMKNSYRIGATSETDVKTHYFTVRWRCIDNLLNGCSRQQLVGLRQDEEVFGKNPIAY